MTDTTDDNESIPRKRNGFLRRLARRIIAQSDSPAADVAEALREREERGDIIEHGQKDMILKAARFDRLQVNDVMRPRAEIVGVEASASLGEAARVFSDSQHSRLPVYRENLDDPLGFVHVRDVMALLAPSEEGESRAKFSDHLCRASNAIFCSLPPR